MKSYIAAAAIAVCFSAGTVSAEERLTLTLPLDCTFGEDCLVQHYVDSDHRLGAVDYECGPLAYEGHQGTDFRLLDNAKINDGYAVIAAAPGKVIDIVGHLPDQNFKIDRNDTLSCGNAIVLDHGHGWTTQYCHLAFASPKVSVGQHVQRGQAIGILGSSGTTDFPHLHFAVRKHGITVDPYTGVSPTRCTAQRAGSMWHPNENIHYVGSALMGFGVTGVFPSAEVISEDHDLLTPPTSKTKPVYIWFQMLGARGGDSVRLIMEAPSGHVIANELFHIDQHTNVSVLNIGISPRDMNQLRWPVGTYKAKMEYRGDDKLLQAEALEFDLPGNPVQASAIERTKNTEVEEIERADTASLDEKAPEKEQAKPSEDKEADETAE